MRLLLIAVMSMALFGCFNGYDKYVGYWQHDREDNKNIFIAQIKKEGEDTYLFQNNVLYAQNSAKNNGSKEHVLHVTKEGLKLDGVLGASYFHLSDDGDVLRVGDRKYLRVTEDFYKTSLKNLTDCQALSQQFRGTLSKRPIYGSDAEKRAYDIKYQEFKVKEANIPDCNSIR